MSDLDMPGPDIVDTSTVSDEQLDNLLADVEEPLAVLLAAAPTLGRDSHLAVTRLKESFDRMRILLSVEVEDRVAQRTEVLRDEISDRKQVAAQRKWLMEYLEQRNAELQQFTYTVSHDLKSPLVTILGFLGLLEKDVESGDSQRIQRNIGPIRSAAEQMGRMLNELLELSRTGESNSERSPVSIAEVAREAVDQLAGEISKSNARVVVRPDLPPVSAVRSQLVHMMQNLIGNAVKYVGDQEQPLVEVDFRLADGEVIYTVRDNGIGIDPRYHEKIFDLFERIDEQREGTGLGLSIVKRVVEAHSGRIWVESEEEKGSTFCFTLTERGLEGLGLNTEV